MRRADRLGLALLAMLLAGTPVAGAQAPAPFDGARAIAALSPERREALQRRYEAWRALPESMRREQRDAWQAWRALPEDERARMQAARAAYRALPIARQQELRTQFDALDSGIRRGWLLGPALGADWPRLHALFAQVPPDERESLLATLRALPPQALADLGVLAQRTPPQAREALRRELLAQPDAQRESWLRRKVDP